MQAACVRASQWFGSTMPARYQRTWCHCAQCAKKGVKSWIWDDRVKEGSKRTHCGSSWRAMQRGGGHRGKPAPPAKPEVQEDQCELLDVAKLLQAGEFEKAKELAQKHKEQQQAGA